jgi:hypothetical protein
MLSLQRQQLLLHSNSSSPYRPALSCSSHSRTLNTRRPCICFGRYWFCMLSMAVITPCTADVYNVRFDRQAVGIQRCSKHSWHECDSKLRVKQQPSSHCQGFRVHVPPVITVWPCNFAVCCGRCRQVTRQHKQSCRQEFPSTTAAKRQNATSAEWSPAQ